MARIDCKRLSSVTEQNNKKSNNNKRIVNPQRSIRAIVDEVDRYVITLITGINNGDQVWDLYTLFVADTQYTDLQARYGMFRFDSLKIEIHSNNPNSTVSTDQQLGVLALQEGIFNTATTKVAGNVANIPNSRWINNVNEFFFTFRINNNSYFPSNMANTSVSEVPKVNMYYGLYQASTTGTVTSNIVFKLVLSCKSKVY
jgi:hypothetical protein